MTINSSLNSLKIALKDVATKNEARQQSFWGCFSSRYVVVKTTEGSFEATKACWFYYSDGKKLATEKDLKEIVNATLFNDLSRNEKIQVHSGLTFLKCHTIATEFLKLAYIKQQKTTEVIEQDEEGWQKFRFQPENTTTASNSSYIMGINPEDLPPVGFRAPNFPHSIISDLKRESLAKQNTVSQSRVQSDSPTTTEASESSSSRESSPQVVRKVTGQSEYRGKLEAQFGVHFLDEVQFSKKKSTIKLSDLSETDRKAIVSYIQRSYLVDPNNPHKGYKGGNSCPPTVYLQEENVLVMNSGFSDGAVKRDLTLTYDTMVRILELKKVKSCAHLYNSPLFQRMKAENA